VTPTSPILDLVLLAGLAAGGLASLVRVAARSIAPTWADRPPVGCPACLGSWLALAAVPAWIWALDAAIETTVAIGIWLGASGVAAAVTAFVVPAVIELPPPA
jgi:hypothetical protein